MTLLLAHFLWIASAWATPSLDSSTKPTLDVWVLAESEDERALMSAMGMGFVEGQEGDWWHMHAEPSALKRLHQSGLTYSFNAERKLLPGEYRSPEEMVSALEGLAADHPDKATLVDIGTSELGRPIVGLRLGTSDTPAHRVRVLGAHHGDETSSAALAFQTAEDLLQNPAFSATLDTTEVWVIPHINPDGVASHSRYNANTVDLNRNYDFEWSTSAFRPGPAPFSEAETSAIRALGAWVDFGLGLSMHSGAINLGWVWNYTTEATLDEALLAHMASSYAEDCTVDGFWITNGAAWYITHGDTTDWSFGRYGTLDFTLEVSSTKSPGPVDLARALMDHSQSVQRIITWPWWISGSVTDSETGLGVAASIQIAEAERTLATGPDGSFSRPMEDGIWTLTVSSPGYHSTVVSADATGGPTEIVLEAAERSANRPHDPWLSSDGNFSLTEPADEVIVFRLGGHSVSASPTADGWWVDPTTLGAGPSTLIIDGMAAPNTLFVPEQRLDAHIDGLVFNGVDLTLNIPGLGRGTQAWGIWGEQRLLVPLPVISEAGTTLVIDARALPFAETAIDLIIWTRGMQLAVVDAIGDTPDEGPDPPPPEDEPPEDDEPDDDVAPALTEDIPPREASPITGSGSKLSAGGCQALHTRYPGAIWLVSLMALATRRRTQCFTD
jgi:carboxypeptidase T